VRQSVNKVPEKEKEKAKKFKEYDPGYLHNDVTYLPKINGVKYYLSVAIDRATRALYYKLYDAKELLKSNSFKFDAEILFVFEAKNISIALVTVSFFNEKDGRKSQSKRMSYSLTEPKCR